MLGTNFYLVESDKGENWKTLIDGNENIIGWVNYPAHEDFEPVIFFEDNDYPVKSSDLEKIHKVIQDN